MSQIDVDVAVLLDPGHLGPHHHPPDPGVGEPGPGEVDRIVRGREIERRGRGRRRVEPLALRERDNIGREPAAQDVTHTRTKIGRAHV